LGVTTSIETTTTDGLPTTTGFTGPTGPPD
jgi:hypothetical protein